MDVWCFVNKEQWTSDVSPLWLVLLSRVGFLSRSSRRWGPLAALWFQCGDTSLWLFCFPLLLTLINVDLHCWRLRMKLSTSPCSSSIASMMHLRSGQAKQVLEMEISLFSNRLDFKIQWTHFNDVWMVSSTRSIASLTWSRRRWIWIKMSFKTSLLFLLNLSAFVQTRRLFSNWPR